MNYEPWAWIPLIGFEREDADRGVGRYVDALGFTPEGLSLFMFSPDVALLHEDTEEEIVLPADYRSYYGSSVNEERGLQPSTNLDVRELVRNFHARRVKVLVGLMGVYMRDACHAEWATMHPETLDRRRTDWDMSLSLMKTMKDGTPLQDFFSRKLAQTLRYYNFDGFHAADYLCPPARPLWESDWSDDMINQFVRVTGVSLPAEVLAPSDETPEQILDHATWIDPECRPDDGVELWGNHEARIHRADWIWRNLRREWIDFHVERWADCWKTISDAVHSIGKQVFVNNAWTHDPIEAIYRYGIDYRRLEAAGVDGVVAETVSAGMTLRGRRHREWHYAYAAMFLMMGAYAPSKKRLFLHCTRDSKEQWDAIRHLPMDVERDMCSLPNLYSVKQGGTLKRCADGFLICLADGMSHAEWGWLRERWDLGFSDIPKRILAPTLILSEHAVNREVDEIARKRRSPANHIVTSLMLKGLGIAASTDISNLDSVHGSVIVVNADLFSVDELDRLFAYTGGPAMLIGRPVEGMPVTDACFNDVQDPDALSCIVYGSACIMQFDPFRREDEEIPGDPMSVAEPGAFYANLLTRRVSDDFLSACARTAMEMCGHPFVVGNSDGITLQAMELQDGKTRVLVKSNHPHYVDTIIDMREPVERVVVKSRFPAAEIAPKGSCFQVRVPPGGITVLDIDKEATECKLQ